MGEGISHSGGPVPGPVVDEILDFLENRFTMEGLTLKRDLSEPLFDKVYWRLDTNGGVRATELPNWKRMYEEFEAIDQEIFELSAELNSEELNNAPPARRQWILQEIEVLKKRKERPLLIIPLDFQPTRQKGIIAYISSHADSLKVVFTQNGSSDEWRDLGGWSKTSHIRPFPGKHLIYCEILHEVQRMVKTAGGDYEIRDELEYCDDYLKPIVPPEDWGEDEE